MGKNVVYLSVFKRTQAHVCICYMHLSFLRNNGNWLSFLIFYRYVLIYAGLIHKNKFIIDRILIVKRLNFLIYCYLCFCEWFQNYQCNLEIPNGDTIYEYISTILRYGFHDSAGNLVQIKLKICTNQIFVL